MSFTRARVQRFNEIGSDVPPPGAYDPKFGSKVKGPVIEKSERFHDGKSVASSNTDYNGSVSSKAASITAIPAFRTPQLPRKKLVTKPSNSNVPRIKSRPITTFKDPNPKYDPRNELADLKVECANKDKTIQEYEKQIDEMKEEILRVEKQLDELKMKRTGVDAQHKKDLDEMINLHREVMSNHNDKYTAELASLRLKLETASKCTDHEVTELRQRVEAEFSDKLLHLESEMAKKSEEQHMLLVSMLKKDEESSRLVESLKSLKLEAEETQLRLTGELYDLRESKQQLIGELEILKKDKELELADLQDEMKHLHTVNVELRLKIKNLREECEAEVGSANAERAKLESKLNELTKLHGDLELKLEKRQQLVLELQSQLSTLECELDECRGECEKVTAEKEQANIVVAQQQAEIRTLKSDFQKDKEALEECLMSENAAQASLEEELRELQSLYAEVKRRLMEAQEELQDAREKHSQVIAKHSEDIEVLSRLHAEEVCQLKQTAEETRQEYLAELDKVSIAADQMVAEAKETSAKEIEAAECRANERADKMIENAETVTRETLAACRAESDERVRRIIAETDAKVKQMESKVEAMVKEAKTAVEEEMRMAVERYTECLEHMETDRKILEERLAQKEVEVTRLTVALDDLKNSALNQESSNHILQCELDQAEAELAEKKEELRTLKDQIRSEAAEMVSKRRRFEVVMHENQATVMALSGRLANSDAEVERLQRELEWGEARAREHRDLLNAMHANSRLVHDQMHSLLEQMDAKKEVIDQLEAENVSQFAAIKATFDAKIDDFKEVTGKEMARLQEECDKKTELNVELKQQLDQMAGKLSAAQELLLKMEMQNDEQATEIANLQLANVRMEQQLTDRNKEHDDRYLRLEMRLSEHIEEANRRITNLHDSLNTMTGKKDYYKNFSMKVDSLLKTERATAEKEKLRRDKLEGDLQNEIDEGKAKIKIAKEDACKLSDDCERLRTECKEITEKYVEMIGHNNPKQKLRYLDKLKDEIFHLKQEAEVKGNTIIQLQRNLEKLTTLPKGKENLSIHRNTTPVSSPHKQLTPLKDRN